MPFCNMQNFLCKRRLIFRNLELVFHTNSNKILRSISQILRHPKKPEIIVIIHYCNIFLMSRIYFFVFCVFVTCKKLHNFWKKHMNIWYPCSHSSEFFVCMFTQAYFGYNLTSIQFDT